MKVQTGNRKVNRNDTCKSPKSFSCLIHDKVIRVKALEWVIVLSHGTSYMNHFRWQCFSLPMCINTYQQTVCSKKYDINAEGKGKPTQNYHWLVTDGHSRSTTVETNIKNFTWTKLNSLVYHLLFCLIHFPLIIWDPLFPNVHEDLSTSYLPRLVHRPYIKKCSQATYQACLQSITIMLL